MVEMAKRDAVVKIADLPDKYVKIIVRKIVKHIVYRWKTEYIAWLTKHIYIGFEGMYYYKSLPEFLWRYIFGANTEVGFKQEYREKKKNGESVFFYDTDKSKVYVYDAYEGKEYVFCGKKTQKKAIEWLVEETIEYIKINDLADPWMVGLHYER